VTRRLILVLGDQLTPDLPSLANGDPARDVVVMGELGEETSYVRHHKKKLILILAAMRHFRDELRDAGWRVDYRELDDGLSSFTDLARAALKEHDADEILVTEPGEWRVDQELARLQDAVGKTVTILPDDRFICSRAEFADWADARKTLRMEYFYREMRRKTDLLMDGETPAGGEWNYDAENRKPPKEGLDPPAPFHVEPDAATREVIDLVKARFAENFGDAEPFGFAVTRADAEKALDHFIKEALPCFGDYQDAMLSDEKFLYHSLLSIYLNLGLLDPLTVCRRAERAWRDGHAPLNAVEGFIRQIIGWREFVRGIYWREGPDYTSTNFFKARRSLPDFYWTGETDMACIAAVVRQTREEAYAHHIQRLMVTGAFALIAGVDPAEVHQWYLEVYADAYEWVEAPNVIGMSQFADGGLLASKPYAASGAYINRMSDYCKKCAYAVSKKTEENACPFNALYWDFLACNEEKLKDNGRLRRVYQNWARMDADRKKAYRAKARATLAAIDRGARI